MKLYGHSGSASTRKVLMLLAEKRQTFEFVGIDLAKGQQASAAFRELHPFGKIPVLDHDGFVLYETRAIVGYLDGLTGAGPLLPEAPRARALAEQWMSNEVSYFANGTLTLLYQLILGPLMGQAPDQASVESARQTLTLGLGVMARALTENPYLAGAEFSLADIYLMPGIQVIQDAKQFDLVAAHPPVAQWWSRVSERASWRSILARPQP